MLYTIEEIEDALVFNDDDMVGDGLYEDDEDDNKLNKKLSFYSLHTLIGIDIASAAHVFGMNSVVHRYGLLTTQNRGRINNCLVLLDS